jgi:deoxyribose-phosphate aldolase
MVDIEALVAKITQEVISELKKGQASSASAPAQIEVDRLPPPGRTGYSPLPSAHQHQHHHHSHEPGKVCAAKITGECAGIGCCSQLIPDRVRNVVQCGADRVGNTLGGKVDQDLASIIDHTLLKAEATQDEVLELCHEARQYRFASVCVNPGWVKLAAETLRGSGVKVCTVVGFPLGATTTLTKVMETRDAIAAGADEIDMVIHIGALKNHQDDWVESDIREVVQASQGKIVKTIFETALLSDEEVIRASKMAKRAGADFVKTSTGFGPGGATAHHVGLMRKTVGPLMGVKASGGIRDQETARQMVDAGATRIGASASVKIVRGEQGGGSY